MNICLVVLSDGWGGAEAVTYELARHLSDKGENVSLIVNQEIVKHYADLNRVNMFSVGSLWNPTALGKSIINSRPTPGAPYRPGNRISSFLYAYSRELLARIYYGRVRTRVMQFLGDNKVEVLHAHLQDSIFLISRLDNAGIARVATLHGEYALRGMSRIHPLMIPLVRWQSKTLGRALGKMDSVTHVSSAFMQDSFRNWGESLRGKSVVIPNGVNVSEVRGSLISRLELKGAYNLLFPGGPKFLKGGDLVIEAMAKATREAPGIHLYVALDVPQNHMLRKMVGHLGLESNVTFSGFLPVRDYRSLLNSVDVLVMPSRQENLALVYLEAMALGKPIIASAAGGTPELVQHERNGLIVQTDPDQVAGAILRLYRDEGLRKQMGLNNLSDIQDRDWSHVVEQYLRVYGDVAHSRQ